MDKSVKSQAVSGIKWTTISKVFVSVVAILQVSILTRFLAKEDFGLMGIAVLVNNFCAIFVDMGMSTAVMHEQKLSKTQFSSFYWFNIFTGFLIFIIVSISSPLIALFYSRNELVSIISLTSVGIFIHSISTLQRTIQQKNLNFKFMSIVDVIAYSLQFLSNIVFAIWGFGVFSLVYSQLISSTFISGAYLYMAIFRERNIMFHFNYREIKDALRIGIYQMGTSTLDFFSRNMDSLILSSHISMELFGIYTLCRNLASRVYHIINPIITNVLTPVLAKFQDEKQKVSDLYVRSVEVLGYVNFFVYGIIAASSYSLIIILYGRSYDAYAFVMACLSLYYAMQSCGNPIGSLIIATGRTDRGFYWTVFRIVFTFLYFNIAAMFQLKLFVVFIVLVPLLTAYPNWWIILRIISNVDFKTAFLLPVKPLLICLPLIFLIIVDRIIDQPILSLIVISSLFMGGYYLLNLLFRCQLQMFVLNVVKKELIKYRKR